MNTQLTPKETEELKNLTNLWNCSEITDEQVKRMECLDRKAMNHLPQYLSLGAGVQSSTLALMAARGEIGPMPKAAIFADTQAEPESVYRWLDWLEKQLPFPVHRVTPT
jgi:3'-phosphoadenosine 5'-phosphosulfate sulfotransferase (PAPS reductase)/FAD synthetase